MKEFRAHFGFHDMPFTPEIPVEQHFSLPYLDEATDAVLRAIEQRRIVAVVGPSGTGKTQLLRRVRKRRLPEARHRVHYVHVTDLGRRDMCRELCTVMDVPMAGNLPAAVHRIQEHIVSLTDTDSLRPVLILDDAHELRPDVLGLLKIITNYEMDSRLVLSIVLLGQPPLRDTLRRTDLEDVTRRLAHIATLRTMTQKETLDYLKHRCTVAGARAFPFDTGACTAIFEIGRGNMRASDHLALKALEVAHLADAKVVDSNHITDASKFLCP
jgi:general secretion pathway protein A